MTRANLLRAGLATFVLASPPLAAQHHAAGTIAVGRAVAGTLGPHDVLLSQDSTYAQDWEIEGVAGQVVTIDLESESFDAYLMVYGPGLEHDLQDDDSGGNCNARLTMRFPQSGAYHIAVTTNEKRQSGDFTLSVTRGTKPTALSRCRRPASR